MMTVDSLRERVAKAVYEFSDGNDYCRDGQIDFLTSALGIYRDDAEELLDSVTPKTSYRVVIEFEVPSNVGEEFDFTQDEYNLQEIIWCDDPDRVVITKAQFSPI